jgi:peptide/nickel transport system ATP-binding protein
VTTAVLAVRGLGVSVSRGSRRLVAVDDVGFEIPEGGSLGIVGESGSGKSLTLRALMALLPPGARADRGVVELAGEPLPLSGPEARKARRRRLGMVFQDPLSGLDPVRNVGSQVAEVPHRVLGQSRSASWRRAIELLGLVGLPDPERHSRSFPHQLSGGMRQRVVIAMALATEPKVLLCDEPTTALDVTVQAQVLDLLDGLRSRLGVAVVFVSHDLAVVRQVCDQLAVMYAGKFVETGPVAEVLDRPGHPYTVGLLEAVVDLDEPNRTPRSIRGMPPDLARLPPGCPFAPRCRLESEDCTMVKPALSPFDARDPVRATRCIHPERLGPYQWQAGRMEPGRMEPDRLEPGQLEPDRLEPGQLEPGQLEPG